MMLENQITIAICDDDRSAREELLLLLKRYQKTQTDWNVRIDEFTEAKAMLESVNRGRAYDLFLLDVLMPQMDGIEAARHLREVGEKSSIVFLTVSVDYAYDAFSVQASHYLLKPVKEKDLFPVLSKTITESKIERQKYIVIATKTSNIKASFSEIVFVESSHRLLKFHLKDGTEIVSKTIRIPFHVAAERLLEEPRFLHMHKSYILNMDYVTEFAGSFFKMSTGTSIPIPRYRQAEAKLAYFNYLSKQGIGTIREE